MDYRLLGAAVAAVLLLPEAEAVSVDPRECFGPAQSQPAAPSRHVRDRVVRVEPAELTMGSGPAIPYLVDLTVRCPGGRIVRLAEPSMLDFGGGEPVGRGVSAFAPYADGWIVLNPQFEYALVALRDGEGEVVTDRLYETSADVDRNYLFRFDAETGRTLFSHGSRLVELDPAVGKRTSWTPRGAGFLRPVGWVGRDSVVFMDGDYGNRVFVGGPDGRLRRLRGLAEAWGTFKAGGLVSGSAFSSAHTHDAHSFTSGVFDASTGESVWTTDRWHATEFSPGGRHILGVDYPWDPQRVAVLDAGSGEQLVRFDFGKSPRRGPWVTSSHWEDETHVLVVVESWSRLWLVRLGVDGSVELAYPEPVRFDDGGIELPAG